MDSAIIGSMSQDLQRETINHVRNIRLAQLLYSSGLPLLLRVAL